MLTLDVWPHTVPDDYGEIGAEMFHPPPPDTPSDTLWLTNVTHPTSWSTSRRKLTIRARRC
jgi:hypothetical protein